jgi:hypothetical protein
MARTGARSEDAKVCFERAIELYKGSAETHVVQLEHAELLAATGRSEDSGPLVAEARETFERLRATPWLERVDTLGIGAASDS